MPEFIEARAHTVSHPVLDGHRPVDALWFPHDWLDETTRQRLILASWRLGSRAYRFAGGDLLCFPSALWLDCNAIHGWPLQRVAGTLCSAAVKPAELSGPSFADAWLAMGGVLRPLRFADATSLDPSQWLTVSEVFVETFDLHPPEVERTLVAPTARDLRQVLGPTVPAAASEDSRKFMEALRQRGASSKGGHVSRAARALGAPISFFSGRVVLGLVIAALVVFLLTSGPSQPGTGIGIVPILFFVGLLRIGISLAARGGARAAEPGRVASGQGRPVGGSLTAAIRARLKKQTPQRWRDWTSRLAMHTGLHRLLGAQHAAYMRRMLAMFDEGRLEDALRHAVPLGADNGESLGQAFGLLGPRNDLALARSTASTSINFGQSFEQHLRALYRRTFEKLDRAGRVDEATFVLAELLRVRQEALDYLEKHSRFKQAAELALGWDMPAAQIVRLQALAGQWREAVLVARRDNVFAEAITLLEKRWPDAAARLRREWADTLVAQGRWLDAVLAIWPLTDERSRASEWLAVVEGAGGTMAARALALRAQCQPESLASRAVLIEALRDDPALGAERAALMQELLRAKTPIDPAARRLAALLVGMTLADQTGPQASFDAKSLKSLVTLAGDAALSADLPDGGKSLPGAVVTPLAACAKLIEWQAPAAGSLAIYDAVPLADGEFLLALGEAGAVRLDARGRRLSRFDKPVHRLVISTDGCSALGLAPRERVWRVTRLELVKATAVDLGLHAFDAFADRFDGMGWTVAMDKRVQVLDTTTGLQEVLWQVVDLPGRVVAIDNSGDMERWVLRLDDESPPNLQQWSYSLPSRRLRARDTVSREGEDIDNTEFQRILVRGFGLVDLRHGTGKDSAARVLPATSPHTPWAEIKGLDAQSATYAANGWLAVLSADQPNANESVRLIDFASGQVRACWHWPTSAGVGLRCVADTWLVFDREGRLSSVDVVTGVHRDISVR